MKTQETSLNAPDFRRFILSHTRITLYSAKFPVGRIGNEGFLNPVSDIPIEKKSFLTYLNKANSFYKKYNRQCKIFYNIRYDVTTCYILSMEVK